MHPKIYIGSKDLDVFEKVISYLYLPLVDKLQNLLKLLKLDIWRHDNNWVLTRMLTKHHLKGGVRSLIIFNNQST